MNKIQDMDFKKIYIKMYVLTFSMYIFIGEFIKGGKLILAINVLLAFGMFQIIFMYKKDKVIIDSVLLLLIILNIYLLISILYSVDRGASIRFYLSFFMCSIFLVVYRNFGKEQLNNELIQKIYIISLIYSYISMMQILIGNKFLKILEIVVRPVYMNEIYNWANYSDRIVGIGIHPGINAFIISIGLYIILSKYVIHRKKINSIDIINIIIMILSIVKTGNRNVFLSFIIVFFAVNTYKSSFNRKLKIIIKYILIVFIGLAIMNILGIEIGVIERFKDSSGQRALEARYVLYELALLLFNQKKIFGHGINTFLHYTFVYNMPEKTHAHNLILQFLAEIGLIGTILFLVFFICNILKNCKLVNKAYMYKKEHIKKRYITQFCLFVQIMILFNSITANPIYEARQLSIYFIAISILLNYKKFNTNEIKTI